MPKSRSHRLQVDLPPGYLTIRNILDMKNCSVNELINVFGVVKDLQAPIKTRGTDWKCTVTLYDLSTEDDLNDGITLNIFRAEDKMPHIKGPGDIILAKNVKIQQPNIWTSLLTNRVSKFWVYEAAKMPRYSPEALASAETPFLSGPFKPSAQESRYATFLASTINRYMIPNQGEFDARKLQSLNVRDKFKLLSEVGDQDFADLFAQVVRTPYDHPDGDWVTLYVSDYSKNNLFFDHGPGDARNAHFRPGDGSGDDTAPESDAGSAYGPALANDRSDWIGPGGKRSIQITAYQTHAEYVRSEVRKGDWLKLRNVRFKFGRNPAYLEGVMDAEKDVLHVRVNVSILDTKNAKAMDSRLKEALKRRAAYFEKLQMHGKRRQRPNNRKREQNEAANDQFAPHPRLSESTAQAKTYRRARRAERAAKLQFAHLQTEEEHSTALIPQSGLNPQVVSEHQAQPLRPFSYILRKVYHPLNVGNGQKIMIPLPFSNNRYRAAVRVVDFYPDSIEDFAVPQDAKELDGGERNKRRRRGSDASDYDSGVFDKSSSRWEWRFALELEDASQAITESKSCANRASTQPQRIFVFVNNYAAQHLLHRDAADLREDYLLYNELREKMQVLWGNLEVVKQRKADWQEKQRARLGHEDKVPPPHSGEFAADPMEELDNKPFACCIQQYGVKVDDKWERKFGIFGTKIRD